MREIPIAKARDELTSLPEQLAEKPATVAVTRRGKPVLAVMPWEIYESIIETLEIMGDEDLMSSLRQAMREVAEGKTIPWDRVKKELNLDVPDRSHSSGAKNAPQYFGSPSPGENPGTHRRPRTRTRKTSKPLIEELTSYRSLRAVGQRYRIIYRVEEERVVVFVLAVGLRKQESRTDIYQLAKKLLRLGLLEPPRKR